MGGGRVRLGGDYQGRGDLPQAKRTYVDLYTRIRRITSYNVCYTKLLRKSARRVTVA